VGGEEVAQAGEEAGRGGGVGVFMPVVVLVSAVVLVSVVWPVPVVVLVRVPVSVLVPGVVRVFASVGAVVLVVPVAHVGSPSGARGGRVGVHEAIMCV
jgi:hypothetical protein